MPRLLFQAQLRKLRQQLSPVEGVGQRRGQQEHAVFDAVLGPGLLEAAVCDVSADDE